MKVITVAAAKGGSTKTTIALSLAARATMDGKHVAMFDLNGDQGDLTKWWKLRGQPMSPRILDVENISQDIELTRKSKRFDYLIIDTPPLDLDIIENAVMESDAVVIPVRPGFFDIDAVTPVVEMCKRRRKPYAFILSAVDSKMPKLIDSALAALVSDGQTLATRIRYLQPYIQSVIKGKAAFEVDKSCEPEISNLWAEVKRLADVKPNLAVVKGGRG